jgi:hypothetical protein
MLGEATLDVSGTFAGEAIRVFILFVAQQSTRGKSKQQSWRGSFESYGGSADSHCTAEQSPWLELI